MWSLLYDDLVRAALKEDLGRAGDLTTDAIVDPGQTARAVFAARKPGRVAGTQVARHVFQALDPTVDVRILVPDGADVHQGRALMEVTGSARAILTGERVALNFLGRLCGIATATAEIVKTLPRGRVVCTRKTTPCLRALEKYAVAMGGGASHRFGLDDGVLIKDNHIALAGGVTQALRKAKARVGHMVKVECEVDTLEQLEEVLKEGVDAVLLDNMSCEQLKKAVQLVDGRAVTEASGGITPETASEIAATGVDLLSLGWLTHSAPVLDLGLDVNPPVVV